MEISSDQRGFRRRIQRLRSVILQGAPITSLARETIQNSLDARKNPRAEPVHVSFELIDLSQDVEFGRDELAGAIRACKESPDCSVLEASELSTAEERLDADTVRCLRISDRNTTGLRDRHWRALVKTRGLSIKTGEGAGGSHGIGKAAPFAVTELRTVFYWSHYTEDGEAIEKFQGKAVLMSHKDSDGEETQGTGFYGLKDGCQELRGDSIPKEFRLLQDGRPVSGTILHILGFRAEQDWRRRIAESVIGNYFYAIFRKRLDVIVEPDEELELLNLDQIDAESLPKWFEFLMAPSSGGDAGEESGAMLAGAYDYWKMIRDGSIRPVERQDQDLGHCRLWIEVAEGLRSRVGFVRSTGMLITTQQRGLIRFPGFRDFAALCVFEDPTGNELLRHMENPQHDQFEPNRLPEKDQDRGRRALKRITDWIRSEVGKRAGPPEGAGRTMLSELAAYLPDLHPDEQFDDGVGAPEHTEPGLFWRTGEH